jgi:hypothetical protein
MTRFTARAACWSAAQSLLARHVLFACLALLTTASVGCQNGQWGGRPAVVPPPGGMLNRPDAYYTPPTVSPGTPLGTQPTSPRSSISLAPGATNAASSPASANRSPSQNTYDVASRVAADSQPIRVLDSTNRSTASANVASSGGMPVHDGTNASGWRNGLPPAVVSSNPFGGLRGTTGGVKSASQGFSGQDGQWRSRSSYEATERR